MSQEMLVRPGDQYHVTGPLGHVTDPRGQVTVAWRLHREGRATVKPVCKAKRFSTRSQPVLVFLILIDDGCTSGCLLGGAFFLVLAGNSNIKLGSAGEEGWEEKMTNEEKRG